MKLLTHIKNKISIWEGDQFILVGDTVLDGDYLVGFKKALFATGPTVDINFFVEDKIKSREEAQGMAFAMYLMTRATFYKVWGLFQEDFDSLFAVHPLIEKLLMDLLQEQVDTVHPDIPMSHATREAIVSITPKERILLSTSLFGPSPSRPPIEFIPLDSTARKKTIKTMPRTKKKPTIKREEI